MSAPLLPSSSSPRPTAPVPVPVVMDLKTCTLSLPLPFTIFTYTNFKSSHSPSSTYTYIISTSSSSIFFTFTHLLLPIHIPPYLTHSLSYPLYQIQQSTPPKLPFSSLHITPTQPSSSPKILKNSLHTPSFFKLHSNQQPYHHPITIITSTLIENGSGGNRPRSNKLG